MDESTEFQRQRWKKATADALLAVKTAGVEVLEPDKSLFQDSVSSLINQHQGTDLGELIAKIQKLDN